MDVLYVHNADFFSCVHQKVLTKAPIGRYLQMMYTPVQK